MFGIAAWLAFGGVVFVLITTLGSEPNATSIAVLATAWALALSSTSRIGPHGQDPFRAQLIAGALVIALAYGIYWLVTWVVEGIGSPISF